jgi:hypothetical protein
VRGDLFTPYLLVNTYYGERDMKKETTQALAYAIKDIKSNGFNFLISKKTKDNFIDIISYKNNAIIFIQLKELTPKKNIEYNNAIISNIFKYDIQAFYKLDVPFNVIKEMWVYIKKNGFYKIPIK